MIYESMFYEINHLGSADYFKIEKGQNFNFPPHLHQCFEFIVILSGKMKLTVDNENFTLEANEAAMIFPHQIHSLESDDSEHLLCIFSPKLIQTYATETMGTIPKFNKFIPDKYLTNLLNCMDMDSSSTAKKGLLYLLCSQFDKNAVYIPRQSDSQKLLHKIFDFVEREFKNDCTLKNLAESTSYDYSYLSRTFRKTVGISFNTYVNHYRLSHACYLMENSNNSILQCALESGYISLRSFNRNFKEHFGITPAEFRKTNLINSKH